MRFVLNERGFYVRNVSESMSLYGMSYSLAMCNSTPTVQRNLSLIFICCICSLCVFVCVCNRSMVHQVIRYGGGFFLGVPNNKPTISESSSWARNKKQYSHKKRAEKKRIAEAINISYCQYDICLYLLKLSLYYLLFFCRKLSEEVICVSVERREKSKRIGQIILVWNHLFNGERCVCMFVSVCDSFLPFCLETPHKRYRE